MSQKLVCVSVAVNTISGKRVTYPLSEWDEVKTSNGRYSLKNKATNKIDEYFVHSIEKLEFFNKIHEPDEEVYEL